MPDTGWKTKRATIAARTRHHGPDDPDVIALAQELSVGRLADHIRNVVETAPAPTAEQIERLRGLLPPAPPRSKVDAADAELAAGGERC